MKRYVPFTLLLTLFLAYACGEKVKHCDTQDPIAELPFLQHAVARDSGEGNLHITEYRYHDSTFFEVFCCDNISDAMSDIYDCEGNRRCQVGGIAGFTCDGFLNKAKKVQVLYP